MRRALLYINSTGRECVDVQIQRTLEKYCEANGIEKFAVFCDDTEQNGIAEPTAYMAIGMAAAGEINTVVTMCAGMLGNTEDEVIEMLFQFRELGIHVETAANDIAEYYEFIESVPDEDGEDEEDCDSTSDFIKAVANMYMR